MRSAVLLLTLLLLGPHAAFANTPVAAAPQVTPKAKIKTSMGDIEVSLFAKQAPQAVANFVNLARQGFYNGALFFKVVPNFLIQTGDPEATGAGGPGYDIERDRGTKLMHNKPGMVSFVPGLNGHAHGSQFVIVLQPTPHLDKKNAAFGEVTMGLEIVEKIAATPTRAAQPIKDVKITAIEITPADLAVAPVTVHRRLQKADVQKLTEAQAIALAQNFGEAQKLGELKSIHLASTSHNGGKVQATYAVDYATRRGTKLILYGWIRREEFRLSETQFILE